MGRKGQAWSVDLVIGVLIFLLVIGVFYVVLINKSNSDTTQLKIASETVATKLVDDPAVGIVEGDAIQQEKLEDMLQKEYDSLRQQFGINSEFCIFLEDDKGNIINITYTNETDTLTYTTIGIGPNNNDLKLAGMPCGTTTQVN